MGQALTASVQRPARDLCNTKSASLPGVISMAMIHAGNDFQAPHARTAEIWFRVQEYNEFAMLTQAASGVIVVKGIHKRAHLPAL